jgi:hypothetical protein
MTPVFPDEPQRLPETPKEPPRTWWRRIVEFMELDTWEGRGALWLVLGLVVIGFWPLVVLGVADVSGTARRMLIAAGPVSICLGFSLLILLCGYRYGEGLNWSRRQTWGMALLFLGLGLLGGVGLWFSEG